MNDTPTRTDATPEATVEIQKNEQAGNLTNRALSKIKADYGTLDYHNVQHTEGVGFTVETLLHHPATLQAIERIYAKLKQQNHPLAQDKAKFKNIVEQSARLAAAYHDYDQTKDPQSPDYIDQNERSSMQSLREEMEKSRGEVVEFSEDEIRLATLPITATVAKPNPLPPQDTTRIVQSVEALEPELKDDPLKDLIILLAKILCDADLSKLGGQWHTDYVPAMWAYFLETKKIKDPFARLYAWSEYLKLQSQLLKNHRYYTEAANDSDNDQSLAKGLARNAGIIDTILSDGQRVEDFFNALGKGQSYHPVSATVQDPSRTNGGKPRVDQIGPKKAR